MKNIRDLTHPFHQFPVYLYHATKPAIVAYDAETEDNARAGGYTEKYVEQEYPKHVNVTDKDGTVTTTVVDAPPAKGASPVAHPDPAPKKGADSAPTTPDKAGK